jgi:transglutaminase-like putative cysteine protease
MILRLLRRSPFQTLLQVFLLLVAINSIVVGLGGIVRGAETSAFLPAALPAVLLGWGLSQTRLKGWQALGGVFFLGGFLLWVRTAQLGWASLRLAAFVPQYWWESTFYLRGGPPLSNLPAIQATAAGLAAQSAAVWARLWAWLAGLRGGENLNDPVIRILLWSLLLWVLSAWAGWAVARNRVLAGLVPALVVLAWVTKYTGTSVTALWLLAVSLLGLLGVSRFDANLRRWGAAGLDYAENIAGSTLTAVVFLTVTLAALGWALPTLSMQDFLDSFRRHETAESRAASSLGLEAGREPARNTPVPPSPVRASRLPNSHLLGSGPELSQDVVFTVRTGELPRIPVSNLENIAPRHYWRSYTFNIYTGMGWVSSPAPSVPYAAGQPLYDRPLGYRLLTQTFNLRHGDEGSLFWTGNLYRSNLPFEVAWRVPPEANYPLAVDPFRGADLLGALNSSPVYQVESLIPEVSVEQLRAAGRDYPEFIRTHYTSLPPRVPERVYALARDLTSAAATPYDEAKALETYLRENYPYSLKIPAPPVGVEVADYFLFDLKTGFCDYYATAMAVMARAVGLPARLVMGYASGTYNAQTAEYVVTAADAHSWVEIYFPGQGWVEFEPTASQPEIARLEKRVEAPASETVSNPQWDKLVRSVYYLPPTARWLFAALAGLAGLAGLLAGLEGWLLSQTSPGFALRWMVRSLYRQGRRLVGPPVPGQTATEFAEKLQKEFPAPDPRLTLLTQAYLQGLFSPQPLSKADLWPVIKAWRGLRWRLFWMRGKRRKKREVKSVK